MPIVDFCYPNVAQERLNRIYIMQFPAQLKLQELGIYPASFYIGQTDPSRGWVIQGEKLVRWDDDDYSKCPEKPILLSYIDVHKDLTDHEIRTCMKKYGWYKNTDGSPEMIIHHTIKDFQIGIIQATEEIKKLDQYYKDFEKTRGFSPYVERQKKKNREDDLHRVPPRDVIYGMCDKALKKVSKDAKIYVTTDAHGHFCDYLISKGYKNLYTESDYEYFPKGYLAERLGVDIVNLVPESKLKMMKFDVIIGNPPYNDPTKKDKNNKLWHAFIRKSFDMLKSGGTLSLVTPASVIATTGFGKKFLSEVSTKYNMKFINYDTNNYFAGIGVDICSWVVVDESYKGKTEVTIKGQNITHDLKNGIPRVGDDLIIHSILEKIANSSHPRIPLKMGQDIAKDDYIKNGFYDVYVSGQKIESTNIHPNTGTNLKFVVPFSASYKNKFITTGYIGMLNCWCSILDTKEGEYLSSIFDLPLIQFFVERYKKTSGFSPAIKNANVPMLESFEDLPKQFNLSEEEVEYLQKNNYV